MNPFKIGSQNVPNRLNGAYPQASTYLDYIQNRKGKRPEEQRQLFDTADEKMKRIHDIIWQTSETDIPVLITGPVGSGKKLLARAIYESKNDLSKAFLQIDCAQHSSSELEQKLFGDSRQSEGEIPVAKLKEAEQGVLVLNNITHTDLNFQTKLLHFLQEQKAEASHPKQGMPFKARIIATSSEDIVKLVSQGKFRQDLYYRLYVLHFEVPSLKERPKDIVLLAQNFLKELGKQKGRDWTFSDKALTKLSTYHWPENVIELQSVIQKAVELNAGDVIASENLLIDGELPPEGLDWIESLPIGQTLQTVETHFILKTLAHHQGNRTHAAKTLGISLRTLRNKINEFTAAGHEVPPPQAGRNLLS